VNTFDSSTKLAVPHKKLNHKKVTHKKAQPVHHKVKPVTKEHAKPHQVTVQKYVRPRVPALFEAGSKHVVVHVNKANTHRHSG